MQLQRRQWGVHAWVTPLHKKNSKQVNDGAILFKARSIYAKNYITVIFLRDFYQFVVFHGLGIYDLIGFTERDSRKVEQAHNHTGFERGSKY